MRRRAAAAEAAPALGAYWSAPAEELLAALGTTRDGLAPLEAARRLPRKPRHAERARFARAWLGSLARQLASPLILILVGAAAVAALVGDWTNALIILAIVGGSALLGAWHERRASAAIVRMLDRIKSTSTVRRAGRSLTVPSDEVVGGDIVLLAAGSLVPGDGVLLEAKDCFIAQAALTGEPMPVEKIPGAVPPGAGIAARRNCAFTGSSVRSGTATLLVVHTGESTVYGSIAGRLRLRPPETEFERGVRSYGFFLTRIMSWLVLIVFAANVFLERPPVDALLFAIALAVGISPELLPAVISVMLARGAHEMAQRGVIVRRLEAIENFGSMDVLCADKTGTLTEGTMVLERALDAAGSPSAAVLEAAGVNAVFETGLANPLDEAVLARVRDEGLDFSGWRKLDEVPYDFVRKRLTIAAEDAAGRRVLVSKGAFAAILGVCTHVRRGERSLPLDAAERGGLEALFAGFSGEGFRVLGVATKPALPQPAYGRGDERDLTFAGFLLFRDPPKAGIEATVAALERRGVRLKIITGDNRFIAAHVARAVGLRDAHIVTGEEIAASGDDALRGIAQRVQLFAEVDPGQKERIVAALKRAGHVVGFLGDGINDAPALHAADVGISVDGAVDVAKEAADIVLLQHDLAVLQRGVEQGRATSANTLKYVAITTSANFGNMLSMAAASFVLPFLPLLATQILLNNFLSDVPGMAIAGDRVDAELTAAPRRWDSRAIRRVMLSYGTLSSVFDGLTFALLLLVFQASPELFRTGWFVESLLTELAIIFVLRTRRRLHRSRPSAGLAWSAGGVAAIAWWLPYSPFAGYLGFVPLPLPMAAALAAVTLLYALASEALKRRYA